MYDDRRQHPRFPILLVAMAHTSMASFEVVCTNVSAGGAFLATRTEVALNAPVEVELKPHGPDGPTVMLHAKVRYLVQRGSGGQPGFSVIWSEAVCPTSRLALEQVLRDVLRLPRFRVVADGLGGRFRFGDLILDDEPEPPARIVLPPAPQPAVAQVVALVDDWEADRDEPHAPSYNAAWVRDTTADDDAGHPPTQEVPAQRFHDEQLAPFAGLAIGDELPDQSWADTAMDASAAGAPIETEAETVELSVALAAVLARELAGGATPEQRSEPGKPISVGAFDDPAFDWSDFDASEPAPEENTDPEENDDDARTIEVSIARLMADRSPSVTVRETTVPAASFRVSAEVPPYEPENDDFGFSAPESASLEPPPDDDYFPEFIPEPEPVQRMTRNTVMRRLSGGFDSAPAAPPAAPNSLDAKSARKKSADQSPAGEKTQTLRSGPRTTSGLSRSFLAKVSTGDHALVATNPPRKPARAAEPTTTNTSSYTDHDVAAHKAAVSRETDEMHADVVFSADLYAPKASAPKPRPPTRGHVEIAESRGGKPMEMVDAGQEVPRVMTESTVAYAREIQAIGPLLHAQTWPIEGEWPEMIPPGLAERYGNLEHIGTGGNGVAFRAVDLHLNRLVVLKFLAHSAMPTELARKYFLREVKLAASLNHPNIVHIYDIGKVDDVLYYAMEYVDGVPLSAYLPVREPIRDWQFFYAVIAQLCEALDHAHAQQILHRDIKPDNVLVAADGVVKLFDFGLARVADEGFGEQSVLIGTPHYMAPEQLMGGRVDHRADIYALGVMVFRLVTGVLPFQDGNVFAAHAVEPVPDPRMFNPSLPAAIVPVIEKAMAKQAAARYSTARELSHDLYNALFGPPLS